MQSSLDKLTPPSLSPHHISGLKVTYPQPPSNSTHVFCNPQSRRLHRSSNGWDRLMDGRTDGRREEAPEGETSRAAAMARVRLKEKEKKRTEECLIRKAVTSLSCRVNYLMSFNAVFYSCQFNAELVLHSWADRQQLSG